MFSPFRATKFIVVELSTTYLRPSRTLCNRRFSTNPPSRSENNNATIHNLNLPSNNNNNDANENYLRNEISSSSESTESNVKKMSSTGNFRGSGATSSKRKHNIRSQIPKIKRIFDGIQINHQQKNRPNNWNQHGYLSSNKPVDEHGSYPVIAINLARSIDLSKVIANVFASKGVRKMRERLSVVLKLRPNSDTTESARFVAVFRYGSVVFFNVSPRDTALLVQKIKRYSVGTLLSGKERKERYCVHVQPPGASTMNTDGRFDVDVPIHDDDYEVDDLVTGDYCIVPELNMKSVDVISNIMAQSVALDAYNDMVDKLLADFEMINNIVTLEGNLTTVDRDKMFRAVAQNNTIFLRLTKVGIKDRVDTAWDLSQYVNVDELMREEFDIDRRFDYIEFKLNLIQQNAKFFLQVLANQKSDSLEYIIIVLISLECVLMCIEMSGLGEPLFTCLGDFVSWPPSFS